MTFDILGIDYTTKEYLNFVTHIQTTVKRLNVDHVGDEALWTPHRVELALWTHYVACELLPEVLEDLPVANGVTTTTTTTTTTLEPSDESNLEPAQAQTTNGK